MNYYFTSDTHFFHGSIIKYTNRPFATVSEMNEKLIQNWNAKVGRTDFIYFLGDFAFKQSNNLSELFKIQSNLKGVFYFILGNHDDRSVINKFKNVAWVGPLKDIRIGGQKITLCHYAMRVWNCSHYGAWHLYGHSHGTLPDDPNSLSTDIGVDRWNFTPVSFDELKPTMSTRNFVPIDHHTPKKGEKW